MTIHRSTDQVQETITALVAEIGEVGRESLQPGQVLRSDLDFDSLALAELVTAIKESLGVTISDAQADALPTVGDVIRHVQGALLVTD
ncbi:acyl carrier protein [Streptomyces sp. NPDC051546]|uniref:acyl carrier protein n=1 Tax=Streptomyces sp. NPDC051546 TaxID=3365655 RepID=UPI00379F5F07